MGYAQLRQIWQFLDRTVEGTFFAEGSDVQFVDDGTGLRGTSSELIVPLERSLVVKFGRSVHAFGLA